MRFLSVLLMACILFLSAFSGIQKPLPNTTKTDCCEQMKGNTACHHNKKGTTPDGDRGKPCCTMLFTCSMCCFLIVDPVAIKPGFATVIPKPAALYKIGDLAAYPSSDWKPPKVLILMTVT